MKNYTTIFAALLLSLFPSQVYSQATPDVENFDSVTAPALPAGWTSVSLTGAQTAVTTTTSPHSAPNAAIIPAPNSVSQTALVSKAYTFSTALPTYELMVRFQHRRGVESNFDGVVLEVSYNGGAFVDVTSPAIAGSFSTGAYNGTISSGFGNPLAGRSAWTGTNATYESVSLTIPAVPDNTTIQFRFLVGTDTVVSGPGQRIDTFSLEPNVNAVSFISPVQSEISPGATVSVNVSVANPSSLAIQAGSGFVSAPSSAFKSITFQRSAFRQRIGAWLSQVSLAESLLPLTSEEFTISVQDIIGQSAAKFTIVSSGADPLFSGASAAVSFISSSPAIPAGLISAEPIFGTVDPCSPPAVVPPSPELGKIVVFPGPFTCSFGQAALAYQARGAVAFIAPPPTPLVPPVIGAYPAPVHVEAATPGLTIPVFTLDFISAGSLLSAFGAPGTAVAQLEGLNGPELRTIAVSSAVNTAGDPKRGDNFVTTLINVVTDVDSDSTPDIRDACKNDAAKTQPGSCGCGVADSDGNSNGVPDCLTSADFKAQVNKLKGEVAKLNIKSKTFKTQKTVVSGLRSAVTSVGVNNAGSIVVSSSTVSISALTQKVDKAVGAALKAKTATKLSAAKKSVNKEITKLLAGIA